MTHTQSQQGTGNIRYLYDHPSGDEEVAGGGQLMTIAMIVMVTMLVMRSRVGDDAWRRCWRQCVMAMRGGDAGNIACGGH